MNCHESDITIQKSLDTLLTAEERAALDDHLAGCSSCRSAWEQYRRLGVATKTWMHQAVTDPGEAFSDRILAALAGSASDGRIPAALSLESEQAEQFGAPASRRKAPRRTVAALATLAVVGLSLVVGAVFPDWLRVGEMDVRSVQHMPTLSSLAALDIRSLIQLGHSAFAPPDIPLSPMIGMAILLTAIVANVGLALYARNKSGRGFA